MPTVADRHAEFARQLESDLEDYPDERGEILLEAGDACHRAGHSQRAIALLTEAVALGGEDGSNEVVPKFVELRWRPDADQAALTVSF